MRLIDFLDVIDPKAKVNLIDSVLTLDFGIKTVGELYDESFFYNNILRNRNVDNVIAVHDKKETYICILCD